MGLFDKLKEKGRGIVTAAKPDDGVAPASESDVRARLHGISGQGIQVTDEGNDVIVSWSAKIASAGIGGADYEYLYRALRIELEPAKNEASGICFKTTTEAELSGSLSISKNWERGQHVGSETVHVIAWLGPHYTEGGADDKGYKFSWSDLREPVMEAITGAGWTYKPQRA
ncbi:MAG: hypothetical protein ABR579_00585 [Actinomycetota bacterium]